MKNILKTISYPTYFIIYTTFFLILSFLFFLYISDGHLFPLIGLHSDKWSFVSDVSTATLGIAVAVGGAFTAMVIADRALSIESRNTFSKLEQTVDTLVKNELESVLSFKKNTEELISLSTNLVNFIEKSKAFEKCFYQIKSNFEPINTYSETDTLEYKSFLNFMESEEGKIFSEEFSSYILEISEVMKIISNILPSVISSEFNKSFFCKSNIDKSEFINVISVFKIKSEQLKFLFSSGRHSNFNNALSCIFNMVDNFHHKKISLLKFEPFNNGSKFEKQIISSGKTLSFLSSVDLICFSSAILNDFEKEPHILSELEIISELYNHLSDKVDPIEVRDLYLKGVVQLYGNLLSRQELTSLIDKAIEKYHTELTYFCKYSKEILTFFNDKNIKALIKPERGQYLSYWLNDNSAISELFELRMKN
ncbi:hypothetical protein [Rheinheimera maricola]|uniref:Phage abortive infection protein n=1 Tax=Rheinheimera maricola TaxID=2793282 RepID=A0ABS7X5Q2_9GAMM|nr:hypothetical protein [Rheinheimera maricola]MBZ9610475.1 hypothetical protein [Rheinheimera maricola]